jgi:ABC-type ATPase involved in cell division
VSFTCAACEQTADEPLAKVVSIAVCGLCGASNVINADGTTRLATGADTTVLNDAELRTLRIARGRIARPDRRQA